MLYQQVHRSFWRRHPVVVGAGLLVVFWWLWNGWYTGVAIAAIVVMLLVARHSRRTRAIRDAGLRARADYEHRLSLAGDSRGVFGRYPPVQSGWFPDPRNRYQIRYFDGSMWTQHAVRR
jgi:hypothetical protein